MPRKYLIFTIPFNLDLFDLQNDKHKYKFFSLSQLFWYSSLSPSKIMNNNLSVSASQSLFLIRSDIFRSIFWDVMTFGFETFSEQKNDSKSENFKSAWERHVDLEIWWKENAFLMTLAKKIRIDFRFNKIDFNEFFWKWSVCLFVALSLLRVSGNDCLLKIDFIKWHQYYNSDQILISVKLLREFISYNACQPGRFRTTICWCMARK